MPQYKLCYFPARGFADSCRMILHYGDADWEDHHVPNEEWAKGKDKTPFGHLPVLTTGGNNYGEATAIARYLGRKFDMMANTDEENLFVDAIVDAVKDILMSWIRPVMIMKDPEEKKKAIAAKRSEFADTFKFIETNIAKKSGEFLGGSKVTWGDLVLCNAWTLLHKKVGIDVSTCPNINAHYQATSKLPKVLSFYEKTKAMPF